MSKTKLVVCWVELYKYVEVPDDETDAETLHRVKNDDEEKSDGWSRTMNLSAKDWSIEEYRE